MRGYRGSSRLCLRLPTFSATAQTMNWLSGTPSYPYFEQSPIRLATRCSFVDAHETLARIAEVRLQWPQEGSYVHREHPNPERPAFELSAARRKRGADRRVARRPAGGRVD